MGKKINNISKREVASNVKEQKLEDNNKPKKSPINFKKPWVLALKFIAVVALAVIAINYTDEKGYYQPGGEANNHTKRKWNYFYEMTKTDTIDVIFIGNSHIYTGLIPEAFSNTFGCNTFILASPGVSVVDAYYCLKEALLVTKPKLVVLETYSLNSTDSWDAKDGGLSDYYKSFDSRHDIKEKIMSSPHIFNIENQAAAWSHTIRNHEFFFRDTNQIRENIRLKAEEEKNKKSKKKPENKLDLGRFVRFSTGLTDSTLALYDSLGAVVKGEEFSVSEQCEEYLQKIKDLCKENDVELMFFTVPMYSKHVVNYGEWHDKILSLVDTTKYKWLDLQNNYDSLLYTPACFEDTYLDNQHATYYGATLFTYKLANYIADSTSIEIPDRSSNKKWIDRFYKSDGFVLNQAYCVEDTVYSVVCKDTVISGLGVKSCKLGQDKNYQNMILMIEKKDEIKDKKTISMNLDIKFDNHLFRTFLDLNKPVDVVPVKHNLYIVNLKKNVEIVKINSLEAK